MRIVREKIGPANSDVNGDNGKRYDWSKFCWDGSAIYVERCFMAGHPTTERTAPLPFLDGKPESCQYIHVPYDWESGGAIYRVRPRYKWTVGQTWRGRTVLRQIAAQSDDGWYWVVELEERTGATVKP